MRGRWKTIYRRKERLKKVAKEEGINETDAEV